MIGPGFCKVIRGTMVPAHWVNRVWSKFQLILRGQSRTCIVGGIAE